MNLPLFACVNSFVHLNGVTLSLEFVAWAFVVHSYFQTGYHYFFYKIYVWHETLNQICCDDLQADINIPLRLVVVKWTFKYFEEFFGLMFGQVSIDNEDDESSIKELTQKGTFDNWCLLLTDRVLANPANERNNNLL